MIPHLFGRATPGVEAYLRNFTTNLRGVPQLSHDLCGSAFV
jgi:hypothetical protein